MNSHNNSIPKNKKEKKKNQPLRIRLAIVKEIMPRFKTYEAASNKNGETYS